ncbi:coronin-2B-like isoform X2 [Tachypleus tridentatus]|uniref:coronin-2B-like isoform X2 n=1 Tax=Tachypleus tridentatus TaxID=6853 RepID=UPI003FD5BF93
MVLLTPLTATNLGLGISLLSSTTDTSITRSSNKMTFRGVRSSKFRHVYGRPARKNNCYECMKITKNAHDSHFCAVNPKFVAIVTESAGGGSFLVIPIEKTGRLEVNAGKVTGHSRPVLDIKWNPFNDNVIASCSDDCTIKLWFIPDEGLKHSNMTKPIMDLHQHYRRVGNIEWHPTAENIILSAGFDNTILIWHVGIGEVMKIIDCHPDSIYSMSFNRDGSLLATTCKDKKLRIIDPRQGKVLKESPCHQGSKASKAVFLGDTGRVFTTGFSKFSDRQWAVWSQHDLSNPLRMENIDSSSGVLFPYYDHDTKIVFLAGKGDGNIRYYEIVDEAPWCHYLHQFLTGSPQRGLGFMPKRGLDVMSCEIFRFYKLHATKDLCEPVSMIVPRKSERFQDDLYPDTVAPTPALTAEEWLSGKNRNPVLLSLKTGAGARTNKPVLYHPDYTTEPNNVVENNRAGHKNISNGDNKNNNVINNVRALDVTNHNKVIELRKRRLPWLEDKEKKDNGAIVCDVVSSGILPVASYVAVNDSDSDPEVEQDEPQTQLELKKACQYQEAEIKKLKEELAARNIRIQELEDQLQKLLTNGSHM